jgi:two-component sensor histidine kinase
LARYLSTGKGPVLDRRFEIEALHRKGHELPVELSITHTNDFGQPVFLGFLRDISERHEHERRRSLLVSELNHRVKNLLGVVDALARQTLRSTSSPEEFAAAFAGRLKNLGAAHEILTDASWERASLPMLVRRTFATLPIDKTQLTLDGPEATLSPRQFLSLSLILHELTTNALKYGALADVEGRIHLQWQLTGNELSLRWREYGEKEVTKPTRIGFGTKMVDTSVSSELRGHCERVWHKNGLELRLKFEIE